MMSTIQRLIELNESEVEREKSGTEEVMRLLKRWKAMNMVRSAMAMVGGLVGLMALIK